MENKNENTLHNHSENISNLTSNIEKNMLTETENANILGLKRERESEENIDIAKNETKKTKTEDSSQISTENNQQLNMIQQPKIYNNHYQTNGYVYGNNPNLINQPMQMQPLYGYPAQPQLYYYNQPQIAPPMTGK